MVETIALVALCWLILFQLLLAAGLPLGHMAWGGADRVLPPTRRWASLITAVVLVLPVAAVAGAAGVPAPRWVIAGFAILFLLSFFANAISKSRVERLHGVPLTLILLASLGWIAWGG